jgi:hypothetical protein
LRFLAISFTHLPDINKHGDVIWYHKTDKGVSINPEEISDVKYKEMPMLTVKDAVGILDHCNIGKFESEIFGIRGKKNKT